MAYLPILRVPCLDSKLLLKFYYSLVRVISPNASRIFVGGGSVLVRGSALFSPARGFVLVFDKVVAGHPVGGLHAREEDSTKFCLCSWEMILVSVPVHTCCVTAAGEGDTGRNAPEEHRPHKPCCLQLPGFAWLKSLNSSLSEEGRVQRKTSV